MRRHLALVLSLLFISMPAFARDSKYSAEQIQILLDTGLTDTAIESLDRHLKKNSRDSDALFLRSTAHIMDGDLAAGRRDLEACLEIDLENRQAWLNRAALDIAEADYPGAVEAFLRAEFLEPDAPDNSLNIGAALLLQGDRAQASNRFQRYLASHSDDPGAFYLVAANYAMAERPELAVPLLIRAVQLDEKTRLRARTDANFAVLVNNPDFQKLLETDSYRPPAGAHSASRSYDFPFTGRDSRLLDATLTALQRAGLPIASGVEVTPLWALIWSDVRIKIAAHETARTVVTLSAEADSYTPAAWATKTDEIFRRIALELSSRLPRVME